MFTLAFYQLVAPLRSLYRCALSGAAGDLAFKATARHSSARVQSRNPSGPRTLSSGELPSVR